MTVPLAGISSVRRSSGNVIEEMAEWCNRPLDRVYPVLFAVAILTPGRLFKFVVVIQDGHRVVASGRTGCSGTPAIPGAWLPSSEPASRSTAG